MSDFLDVLKARRTPVVKDGSVHIPGTGFAFLSDGDILTFSSPESKLVESDDAAMRHRFRISTPAVDRAGDVVLPRGCERYLDRYAKNPQVFFNHASYGLPIARSMSPDGKFGVLVPDDALYADAYFHGKTDESRRCTSCQARVPERRLDRLPASEGHPPAGRPGKGRRDVLDFEYPGPVLPGVGAPRVERGRRPVPTPRPWTG
jgi:hypothetical protein